jgi:hypothetical protein
MDGRDLHHRHLGVSSLLSGLEVENWRKTLQLSPMVRKSRLSSDRTPVKLKEAVVEEPRIKDHLMWMMHSLLNDLQTDITEANERGKTYEIGPDWYQKVSDAIDTAFIDAHARA